MKARTKKSISMLTILFVLLGVSQAFRLTHIMLQKTKEPIVIIAHSMVPSNITLDIIEKEEKKEENKVVEKKEEPVIKEVVQETKKEEPIITTLENSNQYRLTSFYSNDGYGTGSCTGSGLCERDFKVNERGWYTYNGYLVLAGATEELLRSWKIERNPDKHYFRYYDKVNLEIDGITYQGIIIDSCGSCTKLNENRIDLFISNSSSVVDRGYKGKGMINLWY